MNWPIDGIISVVILCMMDDLMSVVEHEATKQDQATIHVHSMEAREHCTTGSSKHATYTYGGNNGRVTEQNK